MGTIDHIKGFYDKVAVEYTAQFINEHEKKPKDIQILKQFQKMVGERQPVWDIGCGPGQTTKYLADLGMKISGLDLSGRMLAQARKAFPKIHFQKGNMLDLEFEEGSVAAVVSFYSVVHFTVDQVKKVFDEIYRILKPGGIFLFTFHTGKGKIHLDEFFGKKVDIDVRLFSIKFMMDCLKNENFTRLEVISREPYPEIEYPSRRTYIFAQRPFPLYTVDPFTV